MQLSIPGTDYFSITVSFKNCPRHKLRQRLVPTLTKIWTPSPWHGTMDYYVARWLVFRVDWYSLQNKARMDR